MLDEKRRERFRELRQREAHETLSGAEREELQLLVDEIEALEAAYLTPATERLRRDQERVEAQNQALQALIRRKEALVERLQAMLAEV